MNQLPQSARARSAWTLVALLVGGAPAAQALQPADGSQSAAMVGSLTREGAVQLVDAALAAKKLGGSPGLNSKDLGGMVIGGQPVYFEYVADRKTLRVYALCYRFRRPPRPGLLEGFYKEEKAGTDTGGGKVEYQAVNSGLYLSRSYPSQVDPAQFLGDIDKLAKAASHWAAEVLPAVSSKVFGAAK